MIQILCLLMIKNFIYNIMYFYSMLNMNVSFEIDKKPDQNTEHRTIKPSYSFYKIPNIVQETVSTINTPKSKDVVCTVKDLLDEMNTYFNVNKTEIICSEEYKEWAKLIADYNKEKKQITKNWNKTEDNLAFKFETDQKNLLDEFHKIEEKLAIKFETDQSEMIKPFELELKKLTQKYEKEKIELWNKYKLC